MGFNESEAIVEEQFDVGDSPALSLGTVSGRVSIRRSSEQTIRVHARKYGRAHAVENTRIEFSRLGDMVNVRTSTNSRGLVGGNSICSVDFDVSVPRGCRIQVETVSADVDVREIGAAAEIKTVSGQISLDEASESSHITTVSGGFTGHALEGVLHLMTVSGSSTITDSRLSEFEVESVSGGITLETELLSTGRYRAKTVSGGVRLQVPSGTGITVQMGSVSGKIQSELPSTVEKVGFGSWQGEINGGGAALHLISVSGSVTISGAGAPVPA
jgi:DUF4097 and DUF4098 domain-containing protein YvlB